MPILWNIRPDDWRDYQVYDKVPVGQQGIWRVKHGVIEEDSPERFHHAASGRDTGAGHVVGLQFLDDGRWRPMMSDTKAEILEHYECIDKMTWPFVESVLIHGLGLGVVLNAALRLPHIKRIDVVELNQDVIDLVGPSYLSDPRVTIHHGDAFTYKFPANLSWDVVWHDIWATISDENLPEMEKLKRRYGNRCRWQGAWAQPECRRLRAIAKMSFEELAEAEWKRFERVHGKSVTKAIKQMMLNQQLATSPLVAQPQEATA